MKWTGVFFFSFFIARTIIFFLFALSHLACDEERVEAAKLLVEHGASIYIENKEEKTPLQLAKGGLGNLLRRIVEGWTWAPGLPIRRPLSKL